MASLPGLHLSQLLEQYPESKVTYAVFSKSRFTGDIKEVKKEAVLMDLGDMEKILFQNSEKLK